MPKLSEGTGVLVRLLTLYLLCNESAPGSLNGKKMKFDREVELLRDVDLTHLPLHGLRRSGPYTTGPKPTPGDGASLAGWRRGGSKGRTWMRG